MTRPVALQGEERERHLEMMKSHNLWPNYPILPLVNRSETGKVGFSVAGVICCMGPRQFEVIIRSMWDLPTGVNSWDEFYQAAPTRVYDSYEAMVDDGWLVD